MPLDTCSTLVWGDLQPAEHLIDSRPRGSNIPERTGVELKPQTARRIARLTDRFVGLKDRAGTLARFWEFVDIRRQVGRPFDVFLGRRRNTLATRTTYHPDRSPSSRMSHRPISGSWVRGHVVDGGLNRPLVGTRHVRLVGADGNGVAGFPFRLDCITGGRARVRHIERSRLVLAAGCWPPTPAEPTRTVACACCFASSNGSFLQKLRRTANRNWRWSAAALVMAMKPPKD